MQPVTWEEADLYTEGLNIVAPLYLARLAKMIGREIEIIIRVAIQA